MYTCLRINRDEVRNTVIVGGIISVRGLLLFVYGAITVVFDGEIGMFTVAVLPITTTQTSVSLCMGILQ